MRETRTVTLREIALMEALGDSGIPVYTGDPRWEYGTLPVRLPSVFQLSRILIWCQSEIPTEEDIAEIRRIAQAQSESIAAFERSEQGGALAGRVSPVLFKQPDGNWTFSRMTRGTTEPKWDANPGSLGEIAQRI